MAAYPEIGETIVLNDLANTLELIAEKGKDAFYTGEIAEKIVAEVQKTWRSYDSRRPFKLRSEDPETSLQKLSRLYNSFGASRQFGWNSRIIELLNIMENFDLESLGDNTAETLHIWSEAMKLVFADRAKYMADTDFAEVPLEGLTSKDYAKLLADKIDMNRPIESVEAGDPGSLRAAPRIFP